MRKQDKYPEDWPEIAERIKRKNNYQCERCGHFHSKITGYVLTVHHLDGDKSNCQDWNLAALCQRYHLIIAARVKMDQMFWENMIPVSDWFRPHLEGYLNARK